MITAFPEAGSRSSELDVYTSILGEIASSGMSMEAQDFVCLVVDKCSSILHPDPYKLQTANGLDFRSAFAESIKTVVGPSNDYYLPYLIIREGRGSDLVHRPVLAKFSEDLRFTRAKKGALGSSSATLVAFEEEDD